jgi:hypothetical protein
MDYTVLQTFVWTAFMPNVKIAGDAISDQMKMSRII